MMQSILRRRRSIRRYTPEPLSPELLKQLEEAVLRSPSSRGLNPWEFVFVTDKARLAQLAEAKSGGHGRFLRDAALGVVVLGNEGLADTWVEDCSIASIILQLACENLGLGSCWVQIRLRQYQPGMSAEERVRQILNIPDHLRVLCVISIGHPAEALPPHARESLHDQKIKSESYS